MRSPPSRSADRKRFTVVSKSFTPISGGPVDAEPAAEFFNRLRYGRWNGPAGEETIVCVIDGESVEIHCHGGIAAAQAILSSLVDAGCEAIAWNELLLVTERDPIRRAALHAMPHATTERAAAILLDQYAGALRHKIEQTLEAIRGRDFTQVQRSIGEMLTNARIGRHLVEPFRVVLVGEPNVGKSSLANTLMGYHRAIVHETPGTTRDAVTAITAIDGWPVELVDTAGMHASSNTVERAGIARAHEQARSADLVLLVVDRSVVASGAESTLRTAWPNILVVYSKCDLPPASGRPDNEADCTTSATMRAGIPELLAKIAQRLAPSVPAAGAAVPFSPPQWQAVEAAACHLQVADYKSAEKALKSLLELNRASNLLPA